MNYIPNIISGLRILLVPIFAVNMISYNYESALYIFILMGLSDYLDGAFARYFKCITVFGAYLDAIADKIMINVAFLILCNIDIIPYYILILAISRDLIICIGIIIKIKINSHKEMNPIFLSKINTFMQIFLVLSCMLFLNNDINIKYIEDITNVVVLTTIASTLEYIYNYKKDILVKNFKLTSTYESTNTYISKKC